eukprot:6732134-Pyramimonas_sp.AAC.1
MFEYLLYMSGDVSFLGQNPPLGEQAPGSGWARPELVHVHSSLSFAWGPEAGGDGLRGESSSGQASWLA